MNEYASKTKEFALLTPVAESGWTCYLFGNKPGGFGLVYKPRKGDVPNLFVRCAMKICFACTWVKEKNHD